MNSRNGKSIIDYIIVTKTMWQRTNDTRARRGREIGTDHYLIKSKMSIENDIDEIKKVSNKDESKHTNLKD